MRKPRLYGLVCCFLVISLWGLQEVSADENSARKKAQDLVLANTEIPKAAAEVLKYADTCTDLKEQAQVRLVLAELYISSQNLSAALEALIPVKSNPDAALKLALLAIYLGQNDTLKDVLLPLFATSDEKLLMQAKALLALHLYRQGDYAAALDTVAKNSDFLSLFLKALIGSKTNNKALLASALESLSKQKQGEYLLPILEQTTSSRYFDPFPELLFSLDFSLSSDSKETADSNESQDDSSKASRIQVGLFANQENAQALQKRLESYGFACFIEKAPNGSSYVFVKMSAQDDPENLIIQLKDKGIEAFWVH